MNKYVFSLLTGCALLSLSVSVCAATDIITGTTGENFDIAAVGNDVVNAAVNDVSVAAQSEWNNVVSGLTSNIGGTVSGMTSQANGVISQIGGLTSSLTGATSQVTGALELATNPQGLLTMATGMNWNQATSLAMGATQNALMGFMNIPPVGIPVKDPTLKGSTASEQAAKTQSATLDDKISSEQQKQVDAIGSRPATQAGEGNATQQQMAQNPEGEPSVDTCPALMASYPRQSQKAYEFVKEHLLDKKDTSKYVTNQKTMQQAVQYVEQNFFIKDNKTKGDEQSKLTADAMQKIQKKRVDYQREVVADILAAGVGVQKYLVEDAKSISLAPTSGCNEIDDLNVGTMILISIAKQTIADIVLQMKLMEYEGIKRVYTEPIGLLDNPQKQDATPETVQ